MITLTTPELSVTLPDRITPTKPLTPLEAETLNRILLARMRYYVKRWLEKGITPEEVQLQLSSLSQSHEFTEKVDDNHDPLTLEARRIAREMLMKDLAKNGLLINEQALELHIQALCKTPQIIERAQEILDIRRQAGREALRKE